MASGTWPAAAKTNLLVMRTMMQASVQEAAQKVSQLLGPARGLNVLVNNAGIAVAGPVEVMSMDEWRAVFEVGAGGSSCLKVNMHTTHLRWRPVHT